MKKTCFVLSSALFLAGCAHGSRVRLQPLNWDSFNRAQIENLINRCGRHSAAYDPQKPPYAVFDWDNTSVFLDIEEAVLVYQIQNLVFRATPEQLNEAICKNIGDGDFAPEFNNLQGARVSIAHIAPDIAESYAWLYRNYRGLGGEKTLEEVSKSPHYRAFASKMRYLYDALDGTFDPLISYPWISYLFTGMTGREVRTLVRQTVEWQLTQPIEIVRWETPEALPGKAGRVSVSWKNGLRLVPEMQELYRTLRENGIDVWVCSASFVDVVKEISSNPAFGYANPEEQVCAMELERGADGRILTQFRKGYVQTRGEGKTKAIERFLVSKYGYGPVFVAGDSEGDENMLQDFADTKLSLIINRLRAPTTDIGRFSKQAADAYKRQDARFLLQGRDENTGLFIPSQASRPFGSDELILLK